MLPPLCSGAVTALSEEGAGPKLEQKLLGLGASRLGSLSVYAFALPSAGTLSPRDEQC